MALVIFFVPEPAKGVAEMVRVVRPGGAVATYAWDMEGGGYPGEPIHAEMRAMGLKPLLPPSFGASRMEALLIFWGYEWPQWVVSCRSQFFSACDAHTSCDAHT